LISGYQWIVLFHRDISPDEHLLSRCMLHPHERLSQLGIEGHKRIQAASVVVIGAGGLAHGVLPYLAAAGVYRLVIVEGDNVEASNLHRQILFTKRDVGTSKAEATRRYLRLQFPEIQVDVIAGFLGETITGDQIPACQLIIDCSDNFSAALAAEAYAQRHNIPMVYGKASRWDGQVTILNGLKGTQLDSFFSGIKGSETSPCSSVGVMAPVVGAVGCIMATEALRLLGGMSSELDGKLWTFDFLGCRTMMVELNDEQKPRDHQNAIDQDLPGLAGEPYLYVDVREAAEMQDGVKDSLHIPFSAISENLHVLPPNNKIVFFCESGERSRQAAAIARFHGMNNVAAVNMREIANRKTSP
jgi:molybdopterin/thiamine biosynthesis adenylyltransferase/rhodanese-related sulfurtransferase